MLTGGTPVTPIVIACVAATDLSDVFTATVDILSKSFLVEVFSAKGCEADEQAEFVLVCETR